uniref:Uncharacterized protein n=1 Tax=Melopsittacus undulatus TaxID=13146 RepID=A0A8V5GZ15_MELUD
MSRTRVPPTAPGALAWDWVMLGVTGMRWGDTGLPQPTPPSPLFSPPPQRFASVPRFVELLVVADEAMARFHGEGLRPYLLTVLAAAARSFRHRSLGNAVELRVTRLLVLGPGTPGPPPTSNAAEMLRNFCRWQQGLNVPDEDDPLHFDTALLFTRQVGTLGGSQLLGVPMGVLSAGGAPQGDWVCAVWGRGHGGGISEVMAPVLSSLEPGEMWSPCSARFITDFLDNGHGTTGSGGAAPVRPRPVRYSPVSPVPCSPQVTASWTGLRSGCRCRRRYRAACTRCCGSASSPSGPSPGTAGTSSRRAPGSGAPATAAAAPCAKPSTSPGPTGHRAHRAAPAWTVPVSASPACRSSP